MDSIESVESYGFPAIRGEAEKSASRRHLPGEDEANREVLQIFQQRYELITKALFICDKPDRMPGALVYSGCRPSGRSPAVCRCQRARRADCM